MDEALKTTTARLAAELASPSRTAPDWSEFEWRTAMAASVMHGVSSLLAGRLQWVGPPIWQDFLANQSEQGCRRERKVRALLGRLDNEAQNRGLPLLAMKGSALLSLEIYKEGERPMSDVDLLACPTDIAETGSLILSVGYEVGSVKLRHIAYEPSHRPTDRAFGEHEDNPVKIELHAAVAEPLPLREVDITAGLISPSAKPGLNSYSSLAKLMRHLLMHTAGNLCTRNVRLIQLYDIAMLAQCLSSADWDEALAPSSDDRSAWWAVPPLALTQRHFPAHMPTHLASTAAEAYAACPTWLRRASSTWQLSEVALSRLDIPLLPGLVWSRGTTDAVGYFLRRLHPLEQAEDAKNLHRQHSLAGSAWAQRPRWRKALSLLVGAQPRPHTLYSIHRAFSYQPVSAA
ncbi:nucleotidyltransferase family protein [Roseateles sp.]|uniref:nucleotidyltransferase family protein n=1 Tax=Roseateles sp. TaxID=1971397 RepID=UPI003D139EBD